MSNHERPHTELTTNGTTLLDTNTTRLVKLGCAAVENISLHNCEHAFLDADCKCIHRGESRVTA